jgi:excisionase family DNA binding protein
VTSQTSTIKIREIKIFIFRRGSRIIRLFDAFATGKVKQCDQMDFFLSVDQVAATLHMHPVSVRRLLVARRLPGTKVGRAWLVSARALAELVDAKATAAEIQAFCDESRAALATRR